MVRMRSAVQICASAPRINIEYMATKKPFFKMQCTVCKNFNYFAKKTKAMGETKLEMSKFCPTCKKHTKHKESKKA